jgi:hypothetical protein
MNIFGRVFGGLLVLISLGWLATIVGIRPGWFGNNQIGGSQGTTTNSLSGQLNPPAGTTPAGKNQTSNFNGTTPVKAVPNSTTGTQTEVEKNPRSATTPPDKAVSQTAPASPTPAASQSAPAAAPVQAGW